MRFAEWKWDYDCEPSYDVCLAASMLESRGLQFMTDFTVKNAVVKIEARLQMEVMGCGLSTPPTEI